MIDLLKMGRASRPGLAGIVFHDGNAAVLNDVFQIAAVVPLGSPRRQRSSWSTPGLARLLFCPAAQFGPVTFLIFMPCACGPMGGGGGAGRYSPIHLSRRRPVRKKVLFPDGFRP